MSDIFVSLVTVLDRTATDLHERITKYHREIDQNYANYELLLIDNGMPSDQLRAVKELLSSLPAIRVVRLSKECPVDDAAFAGLNSAIGDYVLFFDIMTDSAAVVESALVMLTTSNLDLLQGVSVKDQSQGTLNRVGRHLFYWYNSRILGLKMNSRATYLTGFSRRALNNATGLKRSHKYLRHITQHLGYPVSDFEYEPQQVQARRHSVRSGYSGAIEMISSYSIHPLRFVTFIGAIAALVNFIYAIYILLVNAFGPHVVEGWTTTSLQMSAMFFVICLILVIQSEYIGRILTETRGDRPYLIKEELESQMLISNRNRRNIST